MDGGAITPCFDWYFKKKKKKGGRYLRRFLTKQPVTWLLSTPSLPDRNIEGKKKRSQVELTKVKIDILHNHIHIYLIIGDSCAL